MDTLGTIRQQLAKLAEGANVDKEVLTGFVNGRIEELCRAQEWTQLEHEDGFVQTLPNYTTGTVSIAVGATSGTGTGTAFTLAMNGYRFRIGNTVEYYLFTFVGAGAFTIDRPFEGTQDAVDQGFTLWKAIYELPSNLSAIMSLRSMQLSRILERKEPLYLETFHPSRPLYGPAELWSPSGKSAAGNQQIEIYPGPDTGEGLPMRWKEKPPILSASSDALPDWISSTCIKAGVRSDLYRVADDQNRAAAENAEFRRLLAINMQEDTRRMPPAGTHIADRYVQHRVKRVTRGRGDWTTRNWRPSN